MVSPGINLPGRPPSDSAKQSERWNWTSNAIDGAAAANIPWIVSMHAPCLGVGMGMGMGQYDCKVGQDFANKGTGTVFTTVGVGGAGLYDVQGQRFGGRILHHLIGGNRHRAYGTLDVTATADQLSARFVPAKDYSFTDAFTIGRS
jgi:hypothetical protein